MRSLVLMLALLVACSGGDTSDEPSVPTQAAPPSKAKAPKAPAEPEVAPVDQARALALAGDHAGALTAAQQLLSADASDPAVWRLVFQEAQAAGKQADAYDALTGAALKNSPPGALALLRTDLALAAGRPADALAAAMEARADDPGAAAALVARAVLAGAPMPEAPEGTDAKTDPVLALVRFVTAKDARKAAADAAVAAQVTGWRAALIRAEVLAERGELDAALAQFEEVVKQGLPLATVRGNLGRAQAVLAPGAKKGAASPVSSAQAGRWAAEAARLAAGEGDAASVLRGLELARRGLLQGTRADEAADLYASVRKTLADLGAGGDLERDLAGAHASVALAAGRLVVARSASKVAFDGATGPAAEDAAWLGLWSCWSLQDRAGLTQYAGALTGARGQVARGLSAALEGRTADALGLLPSSGLSARDAVYVAQAAATFAGKKSEARLTEAVRKADDAGDPALRISTRLDLEDHVRHSDPRTSAAMRDQLRKLTPEGASGAGLRVELAVRSALADGTGRLPNGELPALGQAWRSALEGQSSMANGPGVLPIAAFGEARVKRASGAVSAEAATQAYARAYEGLPLHRRGALSSGTALDGSQGLPIADDLLALGKGAPTEHQLASALVLHELGHRDRRIRNHLEEATDRFFGLDAGKKDALIDASAALRAGMGRWHAGSAPFPKALLEALEVAETAAAEDARFAALTLKAKAPDLAAITKRHGRLALLSYIEQRGEVWGLAIGPSGGLMRQLGSAAALTTQSDRHLASLLTSAHEKGRATHAPGNALRHTLVDPFAGVLTGHGWYLVVGPAHLQRFLFTTFPEQSNGLRWLADIRTVGNLPLFAMVPDRPENEFDPDRYNPDYLMIGAPAGGAEPEPPPEDKAKAKAKAKAGDKAGELVEAASKGPRCVAQVEGPQEFAAGRRHFEPAFVEQCTGVFASRARFLELGPHARYLHIGGVEEGVQGGFKMADGELGLEEIRRSKLIAQIVVVTASGSPDVQRRRAEAFLDAGAAAVLVLSWDVHKDVLERMLDGFWSALNRDRPVARALAEARDSLMRDALLGEDLDDPSLWGSLVLFTTP